MNPSMLVGCFWVRFTKSAAAKAKSLTVCGKRKISKTTTTKWMLWCHKHIDDIKLAFARVMTAFICIYVTFVKMTLLLLDLRLLINEWPKWAENWYICILRVKVCYESGHQNLKGVILTSKWFLFLEALKIFKKMFFQ